MSTGTGDKQVGANSYEVLSPWANVDPVPLRGIAARLQDLAGKTIGLYLNSKRAARLTLQAVERELLQKVPTAKTSWYQCTGHNIPEMLTEGKDKFAEWVEGVDAVVLAVGD